MELNKIYNMDCLEGMKQMRTGEVHLAFADPPYNVGKDYGNGYNDEQDKIKYLKWCKEWFNELERVSDLVLITPGVVNYLDWIIKIKRPKGIYCHYKSNTRGPSPFRGFARWEPILVYGKLSKRHQPSGDGCNISITYQRDIGKLHPAPKSEKLLIHLIKEFSNEGNIVLDPFIGSGTTAIAAKKLGRNFIGFETNPEYVELANRRLIKTDNPKNHYTSDDWFKEVKETV